MAKHGYDSRVACPEVKAQVRDLLRVVGIVAPFTPLWVGSREKSFYIAPGGNDTRDVCLVPPAAVRNGRASQSSGTVPCGDCRMVLWVPGPGVSIRVKFVLSRNLEYKTRGRHVAKR